MKETRTYITKLVLNANKRDRGPLRRIQEWIFHDGSIDDQGVDLPLPPLSKQNILPSQPMFSLLEVKWNWSWHRSSDADVVSLFSH